MAIYSTLPIIILTYTISKHIWTFVIIDFMGEMCITLFKFITMFCGTDIMNMGSILQNIVSLVEHCYKYELCYVNHVDCLNVNILNVDKCTNMLFFMIDTNNLLMNNKSKLKHSTSFNLN